MPPTFAVVCLVVGLAGLLLYVVGFSLPYWYVETAPDTPPGSQTTGLSHGLWQTRACQQDQCYTQPIEFGVSRAYEAGRVFACATAAMALVSFAFTVFLVKSPRRVWSTRTSAVWACTAIFNLLSDALVAGVERDTLESLGLAGVDPERPIAARLGWCFWLTVASLALFLLLALCCGVYAFSQARSRGDDASGNKRLIAKARHLETSEKAMQEDRLARLEVQDPTLAGPPELYPNLPAPAPSSIMTSVTKTAHVFPSSGSYQPSVYSVNKTSGGNYAIQPSSAAVNIDNRRPQLTALDTPYLPAAPSSGSVQPLGVYSTGGSLGAASSMTERIVLNNHPSGFAMATTRPSLPPAAVSLLKQSDPNDVYSLSLPGGGAPLLGRPAGPQLQGYTTADGFTVAGPPPYSTVPRS